MNLTPLDKMIAWISPQRGLARAKARFHTSVLEAKAGYDAAGKGRRGWSSSKDNQNALARRALPILRANSRELERNNAYAASATRVVVCSTVGTGIKPVARHENTEKRQLADELMKEWSQSTLCDYEGQLNLYGLQSLAMRTESLSGEALAVRRIVNDPSMSVPLKIQLLEGDYLDHNKNTRENGSIIEQGIQTNKKNNRTNYWLFDSHPGEPGRTSFVSKPISADQVAHIYDVRRPGQLRGIPRGVSAFTRLKSLDDYQDARIELQKMASCLAGAITNENDNVAGEVLPERIEPGILLRLKGGEGIEWSSPPPAGDHESFVKPEQRMVASAWGITYESLTGDYSNVNFASGKMGRIQMFINIDRWRRMMLIPQLCKNIERWFIEAALIRGHDISGVTFDWTPPKKEILDLKNELPAIIKEVRSGLNTFSGALRERGIDDPEKHLQELKKDLELFDQLEIVLDIDPRRVTQSGQAQSTNPTTDDNDNESTTNDNE